MNSRTGTRFRIACMAVVLAMSAIAFAAATQSLQGQYLFIYPPLTQSDALSRGLLATYSPIKAIDGKTIQLRGDDGTVYIFTLTADTIFCQGETKVSDWSYLKSVPKKASVTVLTKDASDRMAIVVWDKEPSLTREDGHTEFSLPPMCK